MQRRHVRAAALALVVLLASLGTSLLLLGGDDGGAGRTLAPLDAASADAMRSAATPRVAPPTAEPEPPTAAAPRPEAKDERPAAPDAEVDPPQEREEAPRAPGQLTGVVSDEHDRPLADVAIRLRRMTRRGRGLGDPIELVTDGQGRYVARDLSAGDYGLTLDGRALGRVRMAGSAVVRSGETATADFTLERAIALRGVVLGPDGLPLAGAVIQTQRGQGGGRAESDEEGRFVLDGMGEGLYAVRVGAKGYVTARLDDVAITHERGADLEVRLEIAGQVSGVVRTAGGAPAVGASVFAYRQGRRVAMADSDREGRYALDGLSGGPLELFARTGRYEQTAREEVVVAPGALVTHDVLLSEAARIAGALRDEEGAPLERLRVVARELGGDVTRDDLSDAEGSYALTGLYPGRYLLTVSNRRGEGARLELEVEVTSGEVRRDLTVPSGARLAGRALDAAGEPVAALAVFAVDGDERAMTRTDDAGRFEFSGVAEGSWSLYGRREGSSPLLGRAAAVTVRPGEVLDALELRVYAPAYLSGRVLLRGEPLAGVLVVARGGPVVRAARSDEQGAFRLGPLYDGQYELTADVDSLTLAAAKLGDGVSLRAAPAAFEVVQGAAAARDLVVEVVPGG